MRLGLKKTTNRGHNCYSMKMYSKRKVQKIQEALSEDEQNS